MESVVDDGVASGFAVPVRKRLGKRLPPCLGTEIDDRRRSAEGRSECSAKKIVGRASDLTLRIKVGMHVDPAGKDQSTTRIDMTAAG